MKQQWMTKMESQAHEETVVFIASSVAVTYETDKLIVGY
jgi:hypothetical protein